MNLALLLGIFKDESPALHTREELLTSKEQDHTYLDLLKPRYRLMLGLSSFIAITGVLNGIDALAIYSTKIFEVGVGREAERNGRYGTILMGAI